MDTRTITRGGAVALAMAALLNAGVASAQLSSAAIDCRNTIAKNMAKLLKTGHKTIGSCHKTRDKTPSMILTDCNDIAVADGTKLKYAGTRTKMIDAVTAACPTPVVDELSVLNPIGGYKQWYVTCPIDPCPGISDEFIDTQAELIDCLECVAESAVETPAVATLGMPDPNNLDTDEAKCRGAIAKGYSKYFNTAYKTETACQKTNDASRRPDITTCPDSDPKTKVAGSLTKAEDGVQKACEDLPSIADLDGCAVDTLANLKICSTDAWEDDADDAFLQTIFMESDHCPTSVRTTILGGCSTIGTDPGTCLSGFESGTVLSVGWKGTAHGVDVTDSYTLAVDVTCTGTEKGSCGTCTSTGISYDNPQYEDFLRCSDDPWRKCSIPPFTGPDPVCNNGAGGACKYYLGPPLAVSAAGVPTCTLNVVNTNIIGGTGDPDAGTADFTIDLRAVVHLGIGQERPCPYCRNDPAPQDGNVDGGECAGGVNSGDPCADDDDCPSGDCVGDFGECFGGPRNEQPCDVQGFDLNFANVNGLDSPDSGNSLDCPPTSGANVSGGGLQISLPLTTGTTMKDAVDPCESPNGALSCFCGICSLATETSCNSDAECAGMGVCLAGGSFPGVTRKPNNCTDTICYPVSSDRGQCSSDIAGTPDIDNYCSGLLFANGKGVISCGSNGDCNTYISGSPDPDLWVCPGNNCGTCSVSGFRSCFNDPISISGTPNPGRPILAGAFCLPPSSAPAVNGATGSPGPGTVQTDTIVDLRYTP